MPYNIKLDVKPFLEKNMKRRNLDLPFDSTVRKFLQEHYGDDPFPDVYFTTMHKFLDYPKFTLRRFTREFGVGTWDYAYHAYTYYTEDEVGDLWFCNDLLKKFFNGFPETIWVGDMYRGEKMKEEEKIKMGNIGKFIEEKGEGSFDPLFLKFLQRIYGDSYGEVDITPYMWEIEPRLQMLRYTVYFPNDHAENVYLITDYRTSEKVRMRLDKEFLVNLVGYIPNEIYLSDPEKPKPKS